MADPRLRAVVENSVSGPRLRGAVENWGPRLIANGVDCNDFVRTTASISRWEEWLEAWCATADTHRALAERAEADGHARSAGEAYLRAAVSYHFAKFVWVLDPERNRRATRAAVRALYDAHALLDPTAERIEAPLDGVSVCNNIPFKYRPLVADWIRDQLGPAP